MRDFFTSKEEEKKKKKTMAARTRAVHINGKEISPIHLLQSHLCRVTEQSSVYPVTISAEQQFVHLLCVHRAAPLCLSTAAAPPALRHQPWSHPASDLFTNQMPTYTTQFNQSVSFPLKY